MHILCIALRYNKLALRFYFWDFVILNYEIFVNEFQYSVVSLFIGSGAGLVLSIWFFLAIVLNSKNNFIIVKLTVWVWRGVAIMSGQIIYRFTDAC